MIKKGWRLYLIDIVILLAVVTVVTDIFFTVKKNEQEKAAQLEVAKIDEPVICSIRNGVDGLCLDGKEKPVTFAVMLENHPEARPVFGLGKASLVYEAIAEAPITRFLAIYSTVEDIEQIGPVRSARLFYVDWAEEFDVPYLHCGGSDDALKILKTRYEFDLNEFHNSQYFWRDKTRIAPHNIFTSTELVIKAVEDKKWIIDDNLPAWNYKEEAKMEFRPASQEISINYMNQYFNLAWRYNPEHNDYIRFQGDEQQKDADGSEIRTKNVAILYTESKIIDSYGRRETKTIGSGSATVFQDGRAIEGTWSRPNQESRTRFYNEAGSEIYFNPGPTWIEVVPKHFPRAVFMN